MSSSFESLISILASITLEHASYFFSNEIKWAAIEFISTAMKFTQDLKALFVSKGTEDEGVRPQPLKGTMYRFKLQSLADMQATNENFLKLAKQDEWSAAQKNFHDDKACLQLRMFGFYELHMVYEREIEKVYTRDRYGNVRKKRKGRFGNDFEQAKRYTKLLIQKLELTTAMIDSSENILPNRIKGKRIDSLLKNNQIITKQLPEILYDSISESNFCDIKAKALFVDDACLQFFQDLEPQLKSNPWRMKGADSWEKEFTRISNELEPLYPS